MALFPIFAPGKSRTYTERWVPRGIGGGMLWLVAKEFSAEDRGWLSVARWDHLRVRVETDVAKTDSLIWECTADFRQSRLDWSKFPSYLVCRDVSLRHSLHSRVAFSCTRTRRPFVCVCVCSDRPAFWMRRSIVPCSDIDLPMAFCSVNIEMSSSAKCWQATASDSFYFACLPFACKGGFGWESLALRL